jgi:endonuclease/exonuclease/phosphatase family metal-dependent hydrolase
MSDSPDKSIRILSHNTYLIPKIVVYLFGCFHKYNPSINDCYGQDERFKRLKNMVLDYDVCCLQEVWGYRQHELLQLFKENGYEVPEKYQCWEGVFGSGLMATPYNTYDCFFNSRTGGLFNAFKDTVNVLWNYHHIFKKCGKEKIVNKSLSFTLLDMNNVWKGKYLLVGNLHIHSSNPHRSNKNRKIQRKEIKDTLCLLSQVRDFPDDFEWKKCGVMLMGDFNTALMSRDGKIRDEYFKTLACFGEGCTLIDVVNDITRAEDLVNTFDMKNRYVSINNDDDVGIIDYIFTLNNHPLEGELMPLEVCKSSVLVPKLGNETSDHYALEVSVIPARNNGDGMRISRISCEDLSNTVSQELLESTEDTDDSDEDD